MTLPARRAINFPVYQRNEYILCYIRRRAYSGLEDNQGTGPVRALTASIHPNHCLPRLVAEPIPLSLNRSFPRQN